MTSRFPNRPVDRLALAGTIAVAGAPVVVALAFMPSAQNPFGPLKAALALVCAALVCGLVAARADMAVVAARRLWSSWAVRVLLALLALATLGTVLSDDPRTSLVGAYPEYVGLIVLMAGAVIGFGAAVFVSDEAEFETFARVLVVGLGLVAVYGVAQRMGWDFLGYRETLILSRARSTLGNASNLGVWLLMAWPFAFACARGDRSGGWRVAAWSALGLAALALASTGSRGGLVGGLVGIAVLTTLAWPSLRGDRRRRGLLTALGAGGALVAVTSALSPRVPVFLARSAALAEGTAGWRLQVWRESLQLVAERPFLGSGLSTFAGRFAGVAPRGAADSGLGPAVTGSAHNLVLDAAVSSGAIAGALVLVAAVLLAVGAWRARERAGVALPASCAALAGGFVALQFHFLSLDTIVLGGAVLGIALSCAAPQGNGSSEPVRRGASRALRAAAIVLAVAFALGAVAAAGLVHADVLVKPALRQARAGVEGWPAVSRTLARARASAPWEPAIDRVALVAARSALWWSDRELAYRDGVRYEAALRSPALERDPAVLTERGDFTFQWAGASGSPEAAAAARALYRRATELAPNRAAAWIGIGATYVLRGDSGRAIPPLERATRLAPSSVAAWSNLARAYEMAGRRDDAAAAQRRADELEAQTPAEFR